MAVRSIGAQRADRNIRTADDARRTGDLALPLSARADVTTTRRPRRPHAFRGGCSCDRWWRSRERIETASRRKSRWTINRRERRLADPHADGSPSACIVPHHELVGAMGGELLRISGVFACNPRDQAGEGR